MRNEGLTGWTQARELWERLSLEQDIVEICSNSGEMIQRKYGLHSD